MTTGKCRSCKVIYRWKDGPKLKEAACIHCQKALARHTRYMGKSSAANPCGSNECGYTNTCAQPYTFYQMSEGARISFVRIFGVPVQVFRG